MKLNPIRVPLSLFSILFAWIAVSTAFISAAMMPLTGEQLTEKAANVVSAKVTRFDSNQNGAMEMTLLVAGASKGKGISAGDLLELQSWSIKLKRNDGVIGPSPQGLDPIPKEGDSVTVYLEVDEEGNYQPLWPNGIRIDATAGGDSGEPPLGGKFGAMPASQSGEWDWIVKWNKIKDATEAVRFPLLVAERDLRMKDGKAVRAGVFGATWIDRESLPAFLGKQSGKHRDSKLEAVTELSAKEAADLSADLGKALPQGGYRVARAAGPTSDAIELYINPEGKIAAIIGAER